VKKLSSVYGSKAQSDKKVPTGKLISFDDDTKNNFADLN